MGDGRKRMKIHGVQRIFLSKAATFELIPSHMHVKSMPLGAGCLRMASHAPWACPAASPSHRHPRRGRASSTSAAASSSSALRKAQDRSHGIAYRFIRGYSATLLPQSPLYIYISYLHTTYLIHVTINNYIYVHHRMHIYNLLLAFPCFRPCLSPASRTSPPPWCRSSPPSAPRSSRCCQSPSAA